MDENNDFIEKNEAEKPDAKPTDTGYTPFVRSCSGSYGSPVKDSGFPPQGNPYHPPLGAPTGGYTYSFRRAMPVFNPEKVKIRRLADGAGLTLICFFLTSFILTIIVKIIFSLEYGDKQAAALLADSSLVYLLNAAVSVPASVFPFFILSRMSGYKFRELVSFGKPKKGRTLPTVMLALGVCALSNIASNVLSSLVNGLFNVTLSDPLPPYNRGVSSFFISLFCVGILPAVIEEFAFRGVLLGALRKYFSDGLSIFISAALFGLVHGNFVQTPFAFGVGLVLAFSVVYTGSVIPGMIIHLVNNSFSVMLEYALPTMSPTVSSLVSFMYLIVMLLVGLCGFIILAKTDGTAFRLSENRSELSKRNLGWFCSSPWVIILFVIFVLLSFGIRMF